jgi:hypothetical protein
MTHLPSVMLSPKSLRILFIFALFTSVGVPQAATLVGPPFVNAVISIDYPETQATGAAQIPASFSSAPAVSNGIAADGSTTFRFSLDYAAPGWFRIDTSPNAVPSGSGGNMNLKSSFTFEVAAGYELTQLYATGGGYISLAGDARASTYINLYDSSFTNLITTGGGFKTGATSNHLWLETTGVYSFIPGTTSFSGALFLAAGANDGTQLGGTGAAIFGGLNGFDPSSGSYMSPSYYLTVAPVVSAVPEPSEWALLLAGLTSVSLLVRSNKGRST